MLKQINSFIFSKDLAEEMIFDFRYRFQKFRNYFRILEIIYVCNPSSKGSILSKKFK
jgi:hypothetical protein